MIAYVYCINIIPYRLRSINLIKKKKDAKQTYKNNTSSLQSFNSLS